MLDLRQLNGAQWWDYAMLLSAACLILAGAIYAVLKALSREYIKFLDTVNWHGKLNTYDVYSITVSVQCRKFLKTTSRKQDIVVVDVLGTFHNNATWEELPLWLPAQIKRYVMNHSIPSKTSLDIARYVARSSGRVE